MNIFLIIFSVISFWNPNQKLSFHVEYIKATYIPFNLKTTMSLSSYDVLNFDKKYLKTTVVNDSIALEKFTTSKLFDDNSQATRCELASCIDVRMVLEIVFIEGNKLEIGIDKAGYYSCGNTIYKRNPLLIRWISEFITKIN